jgi:Protein of unknown function (DUF3349)
MALNTRLHGVLDWLREGYPSGVPPKDYIPLLALLRRRLTEDEVREIAHAVASPRIGNGAADADGADIGVLISQLTDAMPSTEDMARVEERLIEHHGWPLEE